jgi:hypothetical protein
LILTSASLIYAFAPLFYVYAPLVHEAMIAIDTNQINAPFSRYY